MGRKERIRGAVFGAFIGDTLGLGVHWIYDTDAIAREAGRLDGPIDPLPGAAKYHPDRRRGQFTHYGDQMLVLLRSVSERGGWDSKDFAGRWRAMWPGYDGYVDKATAATLDGGRSDSDDLFGAARQVPLLTVLADGDPDAYATAARQQAAVTHGDPVLLDAAELFARLLDGVVRGAPVAKALERAADREYRHAPVGSWLDQAADHRDEPAARVVKRYGAHCHTPGAAPATLWLLERFGDSLETCLVENAMAGGDSAARGILLGAVLGARDGEAAIPGAWLETMEATDEIRDLLARAHERISAG